jgi:lipid-binding SYLF domain-containing protein
MFNRRMSVMSGVVALGLALSGQAMAKFTEQEAVKLEADAKATLAKFEAETKGADTVLANAKGVLVCPSITKGGFLVGVESGECVLTKGSATPLYYGTSALKGGFIAGLEKHSMILVLNTDEALAKFTSGSREWEMGVDASLAVAKLGAGATIDTTNLKKAIVVFVFGEKGLIGDVSFQGSRFKKLDLKEEKVSY